MATKRAIIWTDENIKEHISKIIKDLNINRFPTRTEILNSKKGQSLYSCITKENGQINRIAAEMGYTKPFRNDIRSVFVGYESSTDPTRKYDISRIKKILKKGDKVVIDYTGFGNKRVIKGEISQINTHHFTISEKGFLGEIIKSAWNYCDLVLYAARVNGIDIKKEILSNGF